MKDIHWVSPYNIRTDDITKLPVLYGLCDGHRGTNAAAFLATQIEQVAAAPNCNLVSSHASKRRHADCDRSSRRLQDRTRLVYPGLLQSGGHERQHEYHRDQVSAPTASNAQERRRANHSEHRRQRRVHLLRCTSLLGVRER